MIQNDHIYNSIEDTIVSYNQVPKERKYTLAEELNRTYDFLKEANNLEELCVRSALVKVPP